MSYNSRPILIFDTVFKRNTPSATDTDSDSQYAAANIGDLRSFLFWKAASVGTKYLTVDLNRILEPGFESAGASWALGDATVDTANPASGSSHARLAASGAGITGPTSGAVEKHDGSAYKSAEIYNLSYKLAVSGYSAGNAKLQVLFLDEDGNTISTITLTTLTANQGYSTYGKTIGSGGDAEIPSGTYSIKVRAIADGTPTLTLDLDDVLLWESVSPDALLIAGHNLWKANATVSVESSDDVTAALSSWTERLAGFTPADDDALYKAVTAHEARAWRLKIVTANIVPFVAVVVLGEKFQFSRYLKDGFDPAASKPVADSSANAAGQLMNVAIERHERKMSLTFRNVTDSWVNDTFIPGPWAHLKQLKPCGIVWDATNHATEVEYMQLKGGLSSPYNASRRTLALQFEGIEE